MRTFAFVAAIAGVAAVQLESGVKIPSQWKIIENHDFTVTNSNSNTNEKIELTFAIKVNNKDALEKKLLEVSTPSSESYGKLLNLDEINSMTNPSDTSISTLKTFLNEYGIEMNEIDYSSGFMRTIVSKETAEKMLSTTYNNYRHEETDTEVLRCEGNKHVQYILYTIYIYIYTALHCIL